MLLHKLKKELHNLCTAQFVQFPRLKKGCVKPNLFCKMRILVSLQGEDVLNLAEIYQAPIRYNGPTLGVS